MNPTTNPEREFHLAGSELCKWLDGILAHTKPLPVGVSECWGVMRETKDNEGFRFTPICVNGGSLDDVQVISEWEYRHKASDGFGYIYW